jgi:hypothetical protein
MVGRKVRRNPASIHKSHEYKMKVMLKHFGSIITFILATWTFQLKKNGNIGNPIMKIYLDFAKLAEEEKK